MSFQLGIFLAVVACVTAAPPLVPLEKEQPTVIPILSQVEELEPNGTYKFSYEAGNGIKWEEISYEKTLPKVEGRSAGEGSEGDETTEVHVQQGSYSYIAPDGTVISLRYIADENGFRAVGDHLPTPPPLVVSPVIIAREKSGRALDVDKVVKAESSPSVPVVRSEPSPPVPVVVVDKAATAAVPEVKPVETPKEQVVVEEKKPEIVAEVSSPVKEPEVVTSKQKIPSEVTPKVSEVTAEAEKPAPVVKEPEGVSSSEAPASSSAPVVESSSVSA